MMSSDMETLEGKKHDPNVVEEVEAKDKEQSEKEGEEAKEHKEEQEDEQAKDEESEDEEEAEESKPFSKKGRIESGEEGKESSKKAKIDTSTKESVTPTERPTRERKMVDRYMESVGRGSVTKPLSIEKGPGTQLKDIPNVAYKLSKRKPDDNLQSLHHILFGKRAKANTLKKNIGMFSGFVWADDEQEKQRVKVKERLDKCVKEKLIDFCDVLNLQIHKSTLKKEEVALKLLEFLESPHATTEVLLAEKEQKGKKRKAKAKRSRTPSKKQSGEKLKRSSKTEEENNEKEDEGSESADDSQDEDDKGTPVKSVSDKEEEKSEKEGETEKSEEDDETETSKKSAKKDSGTKPKEKSKSGKKDNPPKDVKSPSKSNKKSPGSASVSSSKSKVSSTSSKKSKEEKDDASVVQEKASAKKESAKNQGKVKTSKKAKTEPTNEELHAVVVKILKEVDFNQATLSDIIKQLGTHFGEDLLHRKAEVRAIITDVINNMSDDEEAEAEDDDGENES